MGKSSNTEADLPPPGARQGGVTTSLLYARQGTTFDGPKQPVLSCVGVV